MKADTKRETRRRLIAEVVVNLICEHGLDGVTIRKIAAAVGYSTTILTHYFADKHDVLLFTYKWVSDISYARVREAIERDPADLVAFLEALTHIDKPELWKVNFAFWEIAMNDDNFKQEQQRRAEDAKRFILQILETRSRNGLFVADVDRERVARNLILAVQGLGIQSILHDTDWTPDEKRQFLADIARPVVGG